MQIWIPRSFIRFILMTFFPFAFKVIAPAYSMGMVWVYILSLILLVFSNNFLATYIKRQMAEIDKFEKMEHFEMRDASRLLLLIISGKVLGNLPDTTTVRGNTRLNIRTANTKR